ncbi:type I-E CRISPR-associated protein Cas6/Cse3/CasE [Pseudoclavibacter sp. CFCC 13611]|uniref:type I-E CRISPR-associated protein Cas6/Cse3/CasE n=1 Tax=Pseudoclavibacter sp. CFCC 13611 TaxID=2615178 RepID=UPI0013014890|nr:type I-E CRISPR-associated protein Cas6/Cse3/CasE [Pseudoclavibacter sp. CFCC 13611]KAB1662975.1 type I-E CRISPR-associated protein Cas6/Cse3/CasE [Pseudoclavibacter sp. CFCC 13611]
MTYLSRVTLSPSARKTTRALASPEVLHAIVARATEGSPDATSPRGRTLWRLDRGADRHRLFIVSPSQPDRQVLADELSAEPKGLATLDYAPLLRAVKMGSEWRFRLKANPTKSLSQGEGQRGRRVGLVKTSEQLEWLTSRAQRLGIEFPSNRFGQPEVIVHDSRTVEFRRASATVTLATTVFDGFLIVRDAALLQDALVNGVGRAKGYGYGMLTLAKPDGPKTDG